MKVITTNHPIIVNGARESKPSDYLSASGESAPDDYYGADGMTDVISSKNPIVVDGKDISNPTWYMSAEGSRMSNARANNVGQRIAKLQREKGNAQARIDKINARVSASGKPMGRVDSNIVRGLTKQIARIQATLDNLMNLQSSSADGDDYYGASGDIYSYIDKKNTTDVKGFQTYANSKGAKLVVDGIWGAKTQAEYDKYGAEWEATKNPVAPAVASTVVTNAPAVPQGSTPTANQVAEAKKKGLFWDKLKGAWVYAKEGGILDWVGGLLGIQPPSAFQPTTTTTTTTNTGGGAVITDDKDKDKELSKTTKTLIYVGGALVVGFVIYSLVKKKK